MKVREAAKGVITDSDELCVLVRGNRGKLNLTGGGLSSLLFQGKRVREREVEAFFRETNEEIGVDKELVDVHELFELEGETTSIGGVRRLTFWTLYGAKLPYPHSELYIPPGSEVTEITAMPPGVCLDHPDVQDLAKHAIQRSMDIGFINF